MKMFMRCKDVARLSDYNGTHIGSVIVYKNKIISTGFNSNKTHPLQMIYNRFRKITGYPDIQHKLHAEIHALYPIWDIDIDWKRVDLYVYRIRKDVEMGMARPCPACLKAINNKGIKNIYYTTESGFVHEYLK